MNKKTNLMLAGVFSLLFAWAALPYIPDELWPAFLSRETDPESLVQTDTSQVSRMVLSKNPDEVIELSRQDDGTWLVNGNLASQQIISRLEDAIDQDVIETTASNNPEKFPSYRISSDNYKLELYQGETQMTYLIGDQGSQIDTYFAKRTEEDRVYLVSGELRGLMELQENDWRNKVVANISEDAISTISISQSGQDLFIEKTESGAWQASRGSQTTLLGEVTSDRLTDALAPVEASGYATEDQTNQFSTRFGKSTIIIEDQDNNLTQLSLVKLDNTWLGQVNQDPQIYTFSNSFASAVILNPTDIFAN